MNNILNSNIPFYKKSHKESQYLTSFISQSFQILLEKRRIQRIFKI